MDKKKDRPKTKNNVAQIIDDSVKASGIHANILPKNYTLMTYERTSVLGIKSVGRKGAWIARVDAAHPGANFYHLNINPELTKMPDLHTPISSTAFSVSKGVANVANVMEQVNKVALPVAIGLDSARLGLAIYHDYKRADGKKKETIKTGKVNY